MADLLEHDDTVEQVPGGGEGHRRKHWMDSGVRVLLAEVTAIIADRLGRQGHPRTRNDVGARRRSRVHHFRGR